MARGAALLISNGETYPNLGGSPQLGNTGFDFLGSGRIAGHPDGDLADGRCSRSPRCS